MGTSMAVVKRGKRLCRGIEPREGQSQQGSSGYLQGKRSCWQGRSRKDFSTRMERWLCIRPCQSCEVHFLSAPNQVSEAVTTDLPYCKQERGHGGRIAVDLGDFSVPAEFWGRLSAFHGRRAVRSTFVAVSGWGRPFSRLGKRPMGAAAFGSGGCLAVGQPI